MEGLFIIIAFLAILLLYMIAAEFRDIAKMKGHDGTKYFWFCLFFTIAGWAMVIALPDLNIRYTVPLNETKESTDSPSESTDSDDLPDL